MNIYFLFTLSEFHCSFPGVHILWGIWCLRHFLLLLNVVFPRCLRCRRTSPSLTVGMRPLRSLYGWWHSKAGEEVRYWDIMMPDLFLGIYYYYVFMHTLLNLIEKITQRVCIYIYIETFQAKIKTYIYFLFKRSIFSRKSN